MPFFILHVGLYSQLQAVAPFLGCGSVASLFPLFSQPGVSAIGAALMWNVLSCGGEQRQKFVMKQAVTFKAPALVV